MLIKGNVKGRKSCNISSFTNALVLMAIMFSSHLSAAETLLSAKSISSSSETIFKREAANLLKDPASSGSYERCVQQVNTKLKEWSESSDYRTMALFGKPLVVSCVTMPSSQIIMREMLIKDLVKAGYKVSAGTGIELEIRW